MNKAVMVIMVILALHIFGCNKASVENEVSDNQQELIISSESEATDHTDIVVDGLDEVSSELEDLNEIAS